MTDKIIQAIQKEKGNTFTREFIFNFDSEWKSVIQNIRNAGIDMSNVLIVRK